MKKILIVFSALLVFSCVKLVKDESVLGIPKLEAQTFVLKQKASFGGKSFAKGEKIKVVVSPGSNWIKVYGYKATKDKLTADRVLVIYMFRKEFVKETFDAKLFFKRFYSVLEPEKNKNKK